MPLLCLDTSTSTPVVALVGDDGVLLAGRVLDARAQAVLGAIDDVLVQAGVAKSELIAIAVGAGPGTFTGLRVGVSTARGIAETLRVPLHPVNSLLAVAALDTLGYVGDRVWATIPAGRGELFAQAFAAAVDGSIEPASEVHAASAEAIAELVGHDRRSAAMAPTPESLARAAQVTLAHAREAGDSGDTSIGDPLAVIPAYGRAPDAEPPRMDVRYDDLVAPDIDALLVLEARCFETPWSRAMYEDEFSRPERDVVLLAARDAGANGRLVGAAIGTRIGDCWHVMNVLVDPIARGRGIGSRLVTDLIARTGELGAGEGWTLEVRDGNDAAISLYERHGFETAGRRRHYYEDSGDDALVMWRYAASGAEAAR